MFSRTTSVKQTTNINKARVASYAIEIEKQETPSAFIFF
jgi:hypothetical protein